MDFQRKVPLVTKSIGLALKELYFVVHAFDFSGVNGIVTMIDDTVAMTIEHVGKLDQRFTPGGPGQLTPVVKRLWFCEIWPMEIEISINQLSMNPRHRRSR